MLSVYINCKNLCFLLHSYPRVCRPLEVCRKCAHPPNIFPFFPLKNSRWKRVKHQRDPRLLDPPRRGGRGRHGTSKARTTREGEDFSGVGGDISVDSRESISLFVAFFLYLSPTSLLLSVFFIRSPREKRLFPYSPFFSSLRASGVRARFCPFHTRRFTRPIARGLSRRWKSARRNSESERDGIYVCARIYIGSWESKSFFFSDGASITFFMLSLARLFYDKNTRWRLVQARAAPV